jgi:hypothetical protein
LYIYYKIPCTTLGSSSGEISVPPDEEPSPPPPPPPPPLPPSIDIAVHEHHPPTGDGRRAHGAPHLRQQILQSHLYYEFI